MILFSLTGESRDQRRPKRDVRHRRPKPFDNRLQICAVRKPAHALQYTIRRMLYGHIYVVQHLRCRRHRLYELIGDLLGICIQQAYPLYALYGAQLP